MDTDQIKNDLQKCVDHLVEDLSQIRTGRATPELVEEILVDAYGIKAPIKNYATISATDAKSLVIQPWDKTLIESISKGITNSNLGFQPTIEGSLVRVRIPDLTEERRKEYVKVMKERVEDSRIAVRQVRQKYMKEIEDAVEGGQSEDEGDRIKEVIEKYVKEMNAKIEEIKEEKEKDLMTI